MYPWLKKNAVSKLMLGFWLWGLGLFGCLICLLILCLFVLLSISWCIDIEFCDCGLLAGMGINFLLQKCSSLDSIGQNRFCSVFFILPQDSWETDSTCMWTVVKWVSNIIKESEIFREKDIFHHISFFLHVYHFGRL